MLRALAAIAGGVLLYLSFPPSTLWWLAPVGLAVLGMVLRGRRARAGFGYGLLFGWGFFLPLVYWLQDFLGADFGVAPWLAVCTIQAGLFAVGGAAITVVARLPAAPVFQAALVVGTETLRTHLPLNGFPWGRLGFSQPDGPLLSLAAFGGAPLVAFAVALLGFGLAQLVPRLRQRPRRLLAPLLAVLVPLLASGTAWLGVGTAAQAGTVRVAVVQGNAPNIGLSLMSASERIRANHLAMAADLTEDIRSGRVPQPDLVIWPETAFQLGNDPAADTELAEAIRALGVPSLIGAQLRDSGRASNSMLSWDPRTGPGARYAKRELVPFAEYVPLRSIARWFTPFVDGTGDLTPGQRAGVFRVAGTTVGTIICYEAAYDYPARESIQGGARLLAVPTNNAWFGDSQMSYQQLGMSRLRAVELGRAVVVSATSGVSAIIDPDGSLRERTRLFTADTLLASVPLRDERTVADRVGAWPERVLVGCGLLGLVAGGGYAWGRRRSASSETSDR